MRDERTSCDETEPRRLCAPGRVGREAGSDASSLDDASLCAVMKALADENRLRIVARIAGRGEVCACELLEGLGIKQSTLSHHMKALCGCGLVGCRREGRWCYYSIVGSVALRVSGLFAELAASPRADGGSGAECPQCGLSAGGLASGEPAPDPSRECRPAGR